MAKHKFKLSDLNTLDFNNTGAWPIEARVGSCVIVFLLIGLLGWFLVLSDKRVQLQSLEQRELELRTSFETQAGRAANLEPLKQQLTQMETMLRQVLRQLPSRTEMPDLIVDISQTALATGISTELFQPGVEVVRDFYAEQPITLEMSGTYHQFGRFIGDVASLPRVVIMTFHNISLTPKRAEAGDTAPPGVLSLRGTIQTYRYLEDEELAARATAPTNQAAAAAGATP